ncbi:MAG: peptide chain release factor 2 [Nitrospirae bacterium]|nr:peptide chain release factor 2 [Nitrospirota bacterium]
MIIKEGLKEEFKELKLRVNSLRGYFDTAAIENRLKIIQTELLSEDIWLQPQRTQELLKEKSSIENTLKPLLDIEKRIEDIDVMFELLELEEKESVETFFNDIQIEIKLLREKIDDVEIQSILSGENDKDNAIMSIHPGAGGTESQDWAQMLMRMYLRWAEKKGFKTELVELLYGEEAGIKSATLTITGPYAYGYLKGEAGVHRLVRISPFDVNKRRHTSFAAILVYPEISEDIEVELREDDLRIDTFRASGAGGQHVNKTSSAVRITHIPTGIVVSCQNERSQHKNKATALKILRARLYALKKREQDKKIDELVGEKKDIAWGSQIRSYIFQPYQLVKDHRTGIEMGDVSGVLGGGIDSFIRGYLLLKMS